MTGEGAVDPEGLAAFSEACLCMPLLECCGPSGLPNWAVVPLKDKAATFRSRPSCQHSGQLGSVRAATPVPSTMLSGAVPANAAMIPAGTARLRLSSKRTRSAFVAEQ